MHQYHKEPVHTQEATKVPEVTLGFWIIKILATTLGETGGDAVTMSMNLGYVAGTAIFSLSSMQTFRTSADICEHSSI